MVNKQYGGPGVFVPSEEAPDHLQQRSGSFQDRQRRDSVPSSPLPSNSSMGFDLYKPDYEQTVRARAPRGASLEQLVNDMGELMVSDTRRRDTFPVRNRPSAFFYPWLIFCMLDDAIGPFSAISVDLRALCGIINLFPVLPGIGKQCLRFLSF